MCNLLKKSRSKLKIYSFFENDTNECVVEYAGANEGLQSTIFCKKSRSFWISKKTFVIFFGAAIAAYLKTKNKGA